MAADAGHAPDHQPKAKIFLSYSRKDMVFADRLEAALKTRGFQPLIDRGEIYAFEDWWQRIQALITQADTVIFVLSPEAVASDVCRREVEFAASLNKRFAPVVCKRADDNAVPAPLRRYNYIFCDDEAQFEARMDLLAEALETDIEWIRRHTELGALARKWEAGGKLGPRRLLLHSPLLEEAEQWLARRPSYAPEPTPTTRTFIAESRRAAKQRLVRSVTGILAIAVIVGLGVLGWTNRKDLMLRWDVWRNVLSTSTERTYAQTPRQEFRECTRCPVMVVVPAGAFMMGSPDTEAGRDKYEGPQRKITIAKPFAVSKFEVTFDNEDACVAAGGCTQALDSGWGRGDRPVINVSWDDAKQYVAWLSRLTGKTYRLLSEAEYEYAARAGSTTAYWWGDEIKKDGRVMANCDGCGSQWDNKQTAPVGSFAPNPFGLYDILGNVREWVEDCDAENYLAIAWPNGTALTEGICIVHVHRGGSWIDRPKFLRAAYHYGFFSNARNNTIGFRIARTLLTP